MEEKKTMTLSDVSKMRREGLENQDIADVHHGYVLLEGSVKNLNTIKKEFRDNLESRLSSGTQLSLDLGGNKYLADIKEKTSYSFDLNESDLCDLLDKLGYNKYLTTKSDQARMIAEYKAGMLPADIAVHIKKETQTSLSCTTKKGAGTSV